MSCIDQQNRRRSVLCADMIPATPGKVVWRDALNTPYKMMVMDRTYWEVAI